VGARFDIADDRERVLFRIDAFHGAAGENFAAVRFDERCGRTREER
jgi:hypothetical protein